MISKEQRAEWRKLAEAATPGPWDRGYNNSGFCAVLAESGFVAEMGVGPGSSSADDAAFIAAARDAVPALLDAFEEALRLLELTYDHCPHGALQEHEEAVEEFLNAHLSMSALPRAKGEP